jgi:hypothetical protein
VDPLEWLARLAARDAHGEAHAFEASAEEESELLESPVSNGEKSFVRPISSSAFAGDPAAPGR